MVIEDEPNSVRRGYVHAPRSYALSGKIMLSAIVVLFTVVLLLLCLHIYVRCFLLRRRRRRRDLLRRHARLVFTSDLHQTAPAQTSGGLDIAILRSLPAFAFSSKTHPEPLECAVCLSDFDDGEMGRLLPSCNHCFHTDCIDMWFHSHSTCPLCRSAVKPDSSDRLPPAPESQTEVVVLAEARDGNSASLAEESDASSSSTSSSSSSSPIAPPSPSSFRKKPFGFAGMGIEVPKRNESFKGSEEESGVGSPLRSPGSGILALKRILSREIWPAGGTNCSSSSSSGSEIDLERGEEQSQHQR